VYGTNSVLFMMGKPLTATVTKCSCDNTNGTSCLDPAAERGRASLSHFFANPSSRAI